MNLLRFWGLCAGTAVLAAALPASADPVQPGSAFYVGGNVGYGFGTATATLSETGGMGAGTTSALPDVFPVERPIVQLCV